MGLLSLNLEVLRELLLALLLNNSIDNIELFRLGNKFIPKIKSGIHINKKNKGKFTEYCGGKVTDECIKRGKNSPNPTIRKRATFALNARKWKK